MDNLIDDKFKSHGIRPTAVRNLILRTIGNAPNPLSSSEIETILDTVDRSTITRALSLFSDNGLIHIIEDGTGAAKYECCLSDGHNDMDDRHPHFHCVSCGKTICIHEAEIPPVPLPDGFIPKAYNLTISGICESCAPHQNHL